MQPNKGFTLCEFVVIVAIVAILVGMGSYVNSAESKAKRRAEGEQRCVNMWKNTGYESEYRGDWGCYVKQPDGTWLPQSFMKPGK